LYGLYWLTLNLAEAVRRSASLGSRFALYHHQRQGGEAVIGQLNSACGTAAACASICSNSSLSNSAAASV